MSANREARGPPNYEYAEQRLSGFLGGGGVIGMCTHFGAAFPICTKKVLKVQVCSIQTWPANLNNPHIPRMNGSSQGWVLQEMARIYNMT